MTARLGQHRHVRTGTPKDGTKRQLSGAGTNVVVASHQPAPSATGMGSQPNQVVVEPGRGFAAVQLGDRQRAESRPASGVGAKVAGDIDERAEPIGMAQDERRRAGPALGVSDDGPVLRI